MRLFRLIIDAQDNIRSTKSVIEQRYPHFVFEDGFTEEDEMWTPEVDGQRSPSQPNDAHHASLQKPLSSKLSAQSPFWIAYLQKTKQPVRAWRRLWNIG